MKRTALKRSKTLGRGNGRRRASSSPRAVLSVPTMATVLLLTGFDGGCQCGCGRPADAGNPACWHHVFPKQRWPELIDNAQNVMVVAVDCHANHEVAFCRLPRRSVWRAESLVTTDAMRDYLDRTYGHVAAGNDERLNREEVQSRRPLECAVLRQRKDQDDRSGAVAHYARGDVP